MSAYVLVNGVTTSQTISAVNTNGGTNQATKANVNQVNAQSVSFQVICTGNGSVFAAVQPVGSNDGVNFVNQGGVISTVATPNLSTAMGTLSNNPVEWWGAFVTSVTGGGSVKVIMSA